MDVTVCRDAGTCYAGRTSDVSASGMGLELTRDVVVALAVDSELPLPGERLDVILSTHVAGADAVIGPRLRGRIRYLRRLSQQLYHLGIGFDQNDASADAALQGLIDTARDQRLR
jgi:hypothetical protein